MTKKPVKVGGRSGVYRSRAVRRGLIAAATAFLGWLLRRFFARRRSVTEPPEDRARAKPKLATKATKATKATGKGHKRGGSSAATDRTKES